MPNKQRSAGHAPAPVPAPEYAPAYAPAPAIVFRPVTVSATTRSCSNRPRQTSPSSNAERGVAAAGCRPRPARGTSPAAPWRAPAATPRPSTRPAPAPTPRRTRLPPPPSCAVPVSGAGFAPAPRMRLCGSVCARPCRAQTRREAMHKAARRTAGAAARFGPYSGSPGLAGSAFRARAAPGAAPAPARTRQAGFDRSGDAAYGPFSPEVQSPEKTFDAARTPGNMPTVAAKCRQVPHFSVARRNERRARCNAWRSHHWSAGPKAAVRTRPCRPVFERHNSGAWIRAKSSALGVENRPGREDAFPCTYSSVTICQ